MRASHKNELLQSRLRNRGIDISPFHARSLRLADLTLHGWHEMECGADNGHASVCIERDEDTGRPYRIVLPHDSNTRQRYLVRDLEAGAIRRVEQVCRANGLHYYVQGDPRGCSLYVSDEPLDDQNYSSVGVSCCIDD